MEKKSMRITAEERTEIVDQVCDNTLFSPSARQGLKPWVSQLAPATASYYFETRLGASRDKDDLDLLVCVPTYKRETFADTIQQLPQWSPLERFCKLWGRNDSLVNRFSSSIWLEVDGIHKFSDNTAIKHSIPSLSTCIVPDYQQIDHFLEYEDKVVANRVQLAPVRLDVEMIKEVNGVIFPFNSLKRLDTKWEDLQRVASELPQQSKIIHISFMTGRIPAALKLYVMIPRGEFIEFLKTSGWQGDLNHITQVLESYCPQTRVGEELYVDITLDEYSVEGGSRLGLTFTPQHLINSEEKSAGREPLLQELITAEMLTTEQASELQNWPGQRKIKLSEDSWPAKVSQWLDVKLVLEKNKDPYAKAYLGMSMTPSAFG